MYYSTNAYIIGTSLSKALAGVQYAWSMLHSCTLYINCLCFDVFVHKLASSKTTVDLNKTKGMLLFNAVLVELDHRGGGGRTAGLIDSSLNYYAFASP